MVEIKRRTPGQGYIRKPIGVNKVNTESANAYAAEARMFDQISSTAFAVAAGLQRRTAAEVQKVESDKRYAEQKKRQAASDARIEAAELRRIAAAEKAKRKEEAALAAKQAKALKEQQEEIGKKFGESAVVVDSDGFISVREIPNGLGEHSFEAAQEEMIKRYETRSQNNMKNVLKSVTAQAAGDEELFKKLWSQYVSDTSDQIKNSDVSPYLQDFINTANQYGAGAVVDIQLEKYEENEKNAESDLRINLSDAAAAITNLTSAGNAIQAFELYDNATNRIQNSNLLSPEAKVSSYENLKKTLTDGLFSNIVADATSAQLLQIGSDISDNSWSSETIKSFPRLQSLVPLLDTESWAKLGSSASKAQSKANQIEVQQQNLLDTNMRVNLGSGSAEDLDVIFNENNVNSTAIFVAPNDALSSLIQNNNTYSETQKSFFDRVVNGNTTNAEEVRAVVKVFINENLQGSAVQGVVKNLGLSNDTFTGMLFISDQMKVAGDSDGVILNALERYNTIRSDLDFRKKASEIGGNQIEVSEKDNGLTIAKKIADVINTDIPPSVKRQFLPQYIRLIESNTSLSDVSRQMGKFYESVYLPSQYIYGEERSLYAPEKIFNKVSRGMFSEDPNFRTGVLSESKVAEVIRSGIRTDALSSLPVSPSASYGNNSFERFVNSRVIGMSSTPGKKDYRFGGDDPNVQLEVVTPLTDGSKATYRLVNKNTGDPLIDVNGPVMFDTDMLFNIMKLDQMSQEQDAEALKERNRLTTKKLLDTSFMFGR